MYGLIYRESTLRNCSECAKVGFHSGYFGAGWLTHRSYHRSPLLRDCPTCGRGWASESQIRLRNCVDCGSLIPYKTLVERSAFNNEPYDSVTSFFEKFFENPLKSIVSKRLSYKDTDFDSCDDCSSSTFAPNDDGLDTDGDGLCDVGDPDDDNDDVADEIDNCPLVENLDQNPSVCDDGLCFPIIIKSKGAAVICL